MSAATWLALSAEQRAAVLSFLRETANEQRDVSAGQYPDVAFRARAFGLSLDAAADALGALAGRAGMAADGVVVGLIVPRSSMISAIRAVRDETACSLREAKEAVECGAARCLVAGVVPS